MTRTNTTEYGGAGSTRELAHVLDAMPGTRVFLVTGKASYQQSGAEDALKDQWGKREVHRFQEFNTNPSVQDVNSGIGEYRRFLPDVVVAVGGGSVIDMAKMVNVLAHEQSPAKDYISGTRSITAPGVPLIAIPTTSGAGAEATHFAVVYINGIKYSLAHRNLLPDVSIVDPALTYTLPRTITAETGADALCQAIESYWSLLATPESKESAEQSLRLSLQHLERAVRAPDAESRSGMSEAAHLAGKAINISKTTACHAFSYPFTTHFGVRHGHACALTLPEVFVYNSQGPNSGEVFRELYALLGVHGPEEAKKKLVTLLTNIGLAGKVAPLSADAIRTVMKEASLERMKNNPREMTEDAAERILQNIL